MPATDAALWRCHRVVIAVVLCTSAMLIAVLFVTAPTPALPEVAHTTQSVLTAVTEPPVAAAAVVLPEIVPIAKPAAVLALSIVPVVPASAREVNCLAQAVYYESRGEPDQGQRAVADVVARRAHDKRFPNTVCGVVYQDAGEPGCQFSFACEDRQRGPVDRAAWAKALAVAQYELTGAGRTEDLTAGATYFHTLKVQPSWSRRFIRTAQIGNHIFYRQPGGTYEAQASAASS